jgi:colicin import membrane protein
MFGKRGVAAPVKAPIHSPPPEPEKPVDAEAPAVSPPAVPSPASASEAEEPSCLDPKNPAHKLIPDREHLYPADGTAPEPEPEPAPPPRKPEPEPEKKPTNGDSKHAAPLDDRLQEAKVSIFNDLI